MTLPYELYSVETNWTEEKDGSKAPSLIYQNNTLRNCQVKMVALYLEEITDSDAVTLTRALWNPRLSVRLFQRNETLKPKRHETHANGVHRAMLHVALDKIIRPRDWS